MRKPTFCLSLGSLLLFALIGSANADKPVPRRFEFVYELELDPVRKGTGPVDVFVPLAQSDEHQTIENISIAASLPGEKKVETRYQNPFWHGHLDVSDGKPIKVSITYTATRHVFSNTRFEGVKRNKLTTKERQEHARYLVSNLHVPISGKVIDPIVAEIAPKETSMAKIARATYNYVVDHMEYKKVGTGWGNGDTYWACNEKYGNCTDFHALFNSLARARGIPARFEIGFPVPEGRAEGEIKGYHCWVVFYLPDVGWVPIDASEAQKHPDKRDLFFGTHPADRLKFSVGRDIELGAGHTTGPLNYFVYPHVEVSGQALAKDKMKRRFAYKNLSAAATVAGSAETLVASNSTEATRSPVELGGFLRLDTIYDGTRMQNGQFAFWVVPDRTPTEDGAQFTLHPRLTRFFAKTAPVKLSTLATAHGKIEVDFQNGGKESRSIIRMRHAYFAVQFGALEVLAGQTWDLISPLYPAANNDGMMWNVGNLGDRRPQARVTYTLPVGNGKLIAAGSAGLTGAVDNQDIDGNGQLDGQDGAMPTWQTRVAVEQTLWGNAPLKVGVWGHFARERANPSAPMLDPPVGMSSLALGLDVSVPVTVWLSIEAEAWLGKNLDDIRGGIGQGVAVMPGGSFREIGSRGGWLQAAVRATEQVRVFAGATIDDPDNEDVALTGTMLDAGRIRNVAAFVVGRYRPWPRLQLGLEFLHWRTSYTDVETAVSNRVNLHATYDL